MKDLSDFVAMSREAGSRLDYVQAGGGNTSVKLDDGYMAIKASGYQLKEMTGSSGFVTVDGILLKKYFEQSRVEQTLQSEQNRAEQTLQSEQNRVEQTLRPEQTLQPEQNLIKEVQVEQTETEQIDRNKESMDIAIASIKSINGEVFSRPSVEIGFHSILQKFVLHLHPVYAAVPLCCAGGMEILAGILEAAGIGCIMVPYIMPGYQLTVTIRDAALKYQNDIGVEPKVILMKNHGVITTAQTAGEALSLMDAVNEAVIAGLELPPFESKYCLRECADGFECAEFPETLQDPVIARACGYSVLYPDQLVYIYNEVGISEDEGKKIRIGERILYRSGAKEAEAMHETLLGVAYVHGCITGKGLTPELLNDEQCAQILGWDSEKYRRSLMK